MLNFLPSDQAQFVPPSWITHNGSLAAPSLGSLTGHSTASVGREYGSGVPLEVLAEAVAKISYKGLDLCFC